ncbi:hypothetical protein [Tunicatimonas pelagia]|uniref:hypothetical protein n=1 Tax=Tunicatimonas pelagia TaxID=931531 RepID=UPI002665E286|nr:hypothetical protein [Tunicatimonas pelagia]WKN45853.1 hypothetical protein P0M28_12875 [Tunicatimonas pelagia]
MSEHSLYRNTVDHQLSKVAENDRDFKKQLVVIYSDYMRDIPHDFARLAEQRNLTGIAELHHKHKTTCHVLSLQALSDAFAEARDILKKETAKEVSLNSCTEKVTNICHNTLTQLQEIISS